MKDIFVLADSAGLDMTAASTVWDAIAVKPIIFNAPNGDFRSFWRDMAAWADLVELPLQWRKSRLATFATREVRDLPEWEREQAIWIFRHQDAMDLLGQLPFAPEWIAFFRAQRLFDRRSDWPLAQWAATRLGSMQAFQEVLSSADTLTTSAAFVLERALDAKDRRSISASLEKAWRLFIEVLHQPPPTDRWAHYGAFARIKAGTAFRNDLRRIVQLFTPRMHLRSQYPSYQQTEEVLTLFSVCRIEFECKEYPSLQDFLKVLPAGSPYLCPLLQLASGALVDSLQLACDAEFTDARSDRVSQSVPSITEHPQNKHRSGFLALTRLCAELWCRLLQLDQGKAQAIADGWKPAGFALTTRLWLFSRHEDRSISNDTIVDELVQLPVEDLWAHRKEVMELVRDRSRGAASAKIDALARRIISGPVLREDLDPEDRRRHSDSSTWLYLRALKMGIGSLPEHAQTFLHEIETCRNWHDRTLEESSFFWVWMSEMRRGPIGDPAPIIQAPTEKRVEIAQGLERGDPFNQSDAWHVYCNHDPEGALNSLIATQQVAAHVDRWRDLLWAIVAIEDAGEQSQTRARNVCVQTFEFLTELPIPVLRQLAHPLVDLYVHAVKITTPLNDGYWDLLWQCALAGEQAPKETPVQKDPGYDLISHAINSASGKLAQLMIKRFGWPWTQLAQNDQKRTEERMSMMIASPFAAGLFARAVIVEYIAWLHATLPQLL